MIQIAAICFAVLALGGAIWSHNRSQQEIGAATVRAELAEQQKEAEALNAQRALEGEAYALKLLAKAEQRNRVQAAQLAESQKARQESTNAREQVDPELKAWGDTPVPLFAANRLRERANAITATTGSRGVSVKFGLVPNPPTADPAGPLDESWFSRIRRKLGGLGSGTVD